MLLRTDVVEIDVGCDVVLDVDFVLADDVILNWSLVPRVDVVDCKVNSADDF